MNFVFLALNLIYLVSANDTYHSNQNAEILRKLADLENKVSVLDEKLESCPSGILNPESDGEISKCINCLVWVQVFEVTLHVLIHVIHNCSILIANTQHISSISASSLCSSNITLLFFIVSFHPFYLLIRLKIFEYPRMFEYLDINQWWLWTNGAIVLNSKAVKMANTSFNAVNNAPHPWYIFITDIFLF